MLPENRDPELINVCMLCMHVILFFIIWVTRSSAKIFSLINAKLPNYNSKFIQINKYIKNDIFASKGV